MTKATTKDSGAAETDGSVQAPSGQDESIKDETAPAADSDRTVVDQGEAIASDVYEELTGGERYVRLLKDVEETFVFPNSTRPSTKLLYTKGQIVRLSAIEGRTS